MATIELPIVQLLQASAVETAERPILISRDPGPEEAGAPRAGSIRFDLVDPDGVGIAPGSTNVYIDGVTAVDGLTVKAGFSASWLAISGGYSYEVSRDAEFASEDAVLIRVTSKTSDLLDDGDWSWSFYVEDFEAPILAEAQARDRASVRLAFSEAIQIPAGASFAITAQTAPAVAVAVEGSSSSGSLIDLALDRALSPGATYKVEVTGVEDLAANPVAPGSSALFVGFVHSAPEDRSFDIWGMLPRYNRRADLSGDLRLMTSVYQELADLVLCDIDRFREIYDIERCSEAHLDLLLFGLGNPFATGGLSLEKKRRLCASLVEIYQLKGTAEGIKNVVRFFLGIEIEILPLGRSGASLGTARLDVDLILGSSDPRILYSFVVVVPRELTEDEREELTAIVVYMKPAREHLAAIREPAPPAHGPWELGLDQLGVGSILS